jgi:hypothetical protein
MASQAEALKQKFRDLMRDLHVDIAVALFDEMRADVADEGIGGSPVESGRFSASMRLALNSPDMSSLPTAKGHQRGGARTILLQPVKRFRRKLSDFRVGDKMVVSNSLPYGEDIEFEGWSRTKAPGGVFRVTNKAFIRRWRAIIAAQKASDGMKNK